jgi:hypothetical protein
MSTTTFSVGDTVLFRVGSGTKTAKIEGFRKMGSNDLVFGTVKQSDRVSAVLRDAPDGRMFVRAIGLLEPVGGAV